MSGVLGHICSALNAPGASMNTRLRDLGVDELGRADLALMLEGRLGVELTDSDIELFNTVGDVRRACERALGRAVA